MNQNTFEQMKDAHTEVYSEDDLATLQEMHQTEMAIAQVRQQAERKMPEGFDGSCEECGNDIPPERIALKFYNCVECQRVLENRKKLFGR